MLRQAYGHFFDLTIVNNDIAETIATLENAIDKVHATPQWVPVSWLYWQDIELARAEYLNDSNGNGSRNDNGNGKGNNNGNGNDNEEDECDCEYCTESTFDLKWNDVAKRDEWPMVENLAFDQRAQWFTISISLHKQIEINNFIFCAIIIIFLFMDFLQNASCFH